MKTLARLIADAGVDTAEARILLCQAMSVDAAYLIAHANEMPDDSQEASYAAMLARRKAGEPVAYITGFREFYSLEFNVTAAVLIPRPETELLVDFALEKVALDQAAHVLDMGTGSGCVAISIAKNRPRARVTAVDISEAALNIASANALRLGAQNIDFIHSDWFGALSGRRFDLIVSNPPYIADDDPHLTRGDLRFEPRMALAAAEDGLACLRDLLRLAPRHLVERGWLALEHGHNQAGAVSDELARAGYTDCQNWKDLAGIERMTFARKPSG